MSERLLWRTLMSEHETCELTVTVNLTGTYLQTPRFPQAFTITPGSRVRLRFSAEGSLRQLELFVGGGTGEER